MRRTFRTITVAAVLAGLAAGPALAQSAEAYAVRENGPYAQPGFRNGAPETPVDPASDYARGLAALQGKDYKAAVHFLGRTTDVAPAFAGGWRALGAAFAGQGKWASSRRAYKRALYLRPDEVVSRAGLAVALLALNDPKAAEQAAWLKARAAACNDACPDAATFRALAASGPFAGPPAS
jgi:Flp pilus assembly protein TadD